MHHCQFESRPSPSFMVDLGEEQLLAEIWEIRMPPQIIKLQ